MAKISLKRARKMAGYFTQEEAAELLGVSAATLSHYESGKTSPRYDIAVKMAELYRVPIDDLDFSVSKRSPKSNNEG